MVDDERFGLLPEKFRFSHLFCQRLSDRLVDIHRYIADGPFWDLTVEHNSVTEAEAFSRIQTNGDVIAWAEQHQRTDVLGNILSLQLMDGLLSDLCQFIYEALGSAARGKTAVAFALFRKPLKDNLFYLEWMLADLGAMLTSFVNSDATQFALHSVASPERALRVSRGAVENLYSGFEVDPEFLWQLRFDKKSDFSLEHYWQKALHLITHAEHVRTGFRDINFIFHDDIDRQTDWEDLYSKVPWLLYYAVEVCESLLILITKTSPIDWRSSWLHRGVGLVLWHREIARWHGEGDSDFRVPGLDLICSCGFNIERERLVRRFYVDGQVKCPRCGCVNTAQQFLTSSRAKAHDEK